MKKIIIPSIIVIGIVVLGVAVGFGQVTLNDEDQKWKDFTDNLEVIEYANIGVKDNNGIWKPTQEDFKEIYQYVYGYDLVPWQKMDGTEMSPLQCKLKDGKEIIKPNGKCELERINLIPQWEQEWNNNVERGEFNGDALKELRKDTKEGMINHDIDVSKIIIKKQNKDYFAWLKNLIKTVLAGTEFQDTFTDNDDTQLSGHTPDIGTGWTIIDQTDNGDIQITFNQLTRDSQPCSNFGNSCGALYEGDDTISSANYEVFITQVDGDTSDDTNSLCCRIQDASNMYCVRYNESVSDLYEQVGGGWSTIDTGGGAIADGSEVKIICDGTTISVEDDDSEILTATDSSHSSAGKGGYGMGAIMVGGDDLSSQDADDYQVDTLVAPPAPADEPVFQDSIWWD